MYQKAFSSWEPFTWQEAKEEFSSKSSQKVMNEAAEFGLKSGCGISFYQSGKITGIGFSSQDTHFKSDLESLRLIQTAAYHFLMAYNDLTKCSLFGDVPIKLTPREREVLIWIACGKSKTQTSDILSISESCVKRHCENIFLKLNANSLPAAVAKALKFGLIDPI